MIDKNTAGYNPALLTKETYKERKTAGADTALFAKENFKWMIAGLVVIAL